MHRPTRRIFAGFTLIELLIAIVIVAILASIAIPSYRAYVLRSRREDAVSALLRISTAEEKFFLQNKTYTISTAPGGLGTGAVSDNGYYDIAIVAGPNGIGTGYSATATPNATGGQTDDAKCASFTIDQTGQRTATGTDPTPNQTCWH